MYKKVNEVFNHFIKDANMVSVKKIDIGHINQTYFITDKKTDNTKNKYVLQKINTKIFTQPEELVNSIVKVTQHIRNKLIEMGGDVDRGTINLLKSSQDQYYYKDDEENYWRCYIYINNSRTYQVVESPSHLTAAAKAIGQFQKFLLDFPAEDLFIIIPDFHNTKLRYKAFAKAVEADAFGRAQFVQDEINFVKARENDTSLLIDLYESGKLPLRVTHNDTKFNNILIDDNTGEGVAVIDLDLVMPGLSLYDFGDSIRSSTNPAEEDEKDLSKVEMNLELFEAFTKGYLGVVGDILTDAEIEYLPISGKIMTLECGIRFLTDYLSGDTYFKIHRDRHNVDRCRTQFKMVADMENKMDEMKAIVKKYL
jgi:hypothetical protein